MKSVQRIIFSILTLVVIMSMANPVFAEEQKKSEAIRYRDEFDFDVSE